MGGPPLSFARPEVLALAPFLVLVVSLSLRAQWVRGLKLVDAYGGGAAAERLTGRDLTPFPVLRLGALLVAVGALTVAAAGPERSEDPAGDDEAVDVVVALDLSMSMLAEDVGTSRIRRATEIVSRITEVLPEDRVAVTVFADWPYTLVPPTDDPALVRFFADSLNPVFLGNRDQGTALASVLSHARRTLDARRRPDASGVIILISDGEIHGEASEVIDSTSWAAADGVQVWTASLGTTGGAPLPDPAVEGASLRDDEGATVMTRMNEALLRDVASAGGGNYYGATSERGVRALLGDLTDITGAISTADGRPRLAFWLTLLALPLLLLEGAVDAGRRLGAGFARRRL